MEIMLVCLVIGGLLGSAYTYFKVKQRYQQKIKQLSQHIIYLERKEQKRLKNSQIYKNKLKSQENIEPEPEIFNYQQQLQYIQQCRLSSKKPINREAVRYFYYLNEWIKKYQPDWYLSFEVSMGSFITTYEDTNEDLQNLAFRSFNSKRVDFLLIDQTGKPKCVIEYNGSGHFLSSDAIERMKVKKLALKKVGIPLIEVPEGAEKKQIYAVLSSFI